MKHETRLKALCPETREAGGEGGGGLELFVPCNSCEQCCSISQSLSMIALAVVNNPDSCPSIDKVLLAWQSP